MFDLLSKTKKDNVKDKNISIPKRKFKKYVKLEEDDLNEKLSIILNDKEYAEVKEFGLYLDVDIDKHPYIIYTVWVAMNAELPPDWEMHETEDNIYYFYNKLLNYSIWEHPLDDCYRKIIKDKIFNIENN